MSKNVIAPKKIQAAIIHQIIKDEEHVKAPVPPVIRKKLHGQHDKIIKLLDLLEDLKRKHGSASSCISSFSEDSTLGIILYNYFNSTDKITAEPDEDPIILKSETKEQTLQRRLTNQLAHALHYHIYKNPNTTGDHIPIIFYQEDGIDYLYFALMSLKAGLTIEEQTGSILDTTTIDTSALKIACKVNLTELQKHSKNTTIDISKVESYISWIQRGGNEKISEYIQDFIPVAHRLDDKKATRKLMKTIQNYLKSEKDEFSHSASIDLQTRIINLLKNRAKHKRNISIIDDIDTIINAHSLSENIQPTKSFCEFRESIKYDKDTSANANIFAPSGDSLLNFEFFEVNLNSHSENGINLKGQISTLKNSVRLIVDGEEKYIRIDVEDQDLANVKQNLKYDQ